MFGAFYVAERALFPTIILRSAIISHVTTKKYEIKRQNV
tara:strand:+ start:888 stop:1004 length:117 start_codon:yes stop_codon:yes gene_type:complete